eukprot:3351235-Amphidinium_carterae.1
MRDANFTVASIHGDMPQKDWKKLLHDQAVTTFPERNALQERDTIMTQFRSGQTRVLISTDLWGRGLDVQQALGIGSRSTPQNMFGSCYLLR